MLSRGRRRPLDTLSRSCDRCAVRDEPAELRRGRAAFASVMWCGRHPCMIGAGSADLMSTKVAIGYAGPRKWGITCSPMMRMVSSWICCGTVPIWVKNSTSSAPASTRRFT